MSEEKEQVIKMSNAAVIRNRMKSIRQTVQLAGAQKLIAGAQLVKARRMFGQTQAFHDRIQHTIAAILGDCEIKSKYLDTGAEPEKLGLLVISADRGLAGGYNHNVTKLVESTIAKNPVVKVLATGRACYRKLSHMDVPLDHDFLYTVEKPTIHTAREIAERIVEMFESGEVDSFDVIYTHFRSSLHMEPTLERLFPLSPEILGDPPVHFSEYDPSPDAVLEILIPKYLKGFLFGSLVQAWLCELNSRVNAMDSAIKNGNEMLGKLSLTYNRIRQGAITQEITEIVAAATSMEED